MAVDNKEVKEFEDKYKEVLFGKVREISSQQHQLISQIRQLGKYADLETDLPNLGTTLNNKLVILQHEFQDAGISMYSQKVEDYGPLKLNFVGSSYVGDAIIYDLINYASKGAQNLADYNKTMKEVTDKKVEKVQALEKASPVRRFFAKLRNFFIPVKQEDLSYTQEETNLVNSHLLDYINTDKQLWNYNLRDNAISSIVRKIREQRYYASGVPGLLEESVIPDLEKLGLADLIPQLQQALIEEYKKDLPNSEIYQVKDEDLYLYVPDFTRKSGRTEEVDFEELHKQAKSVIADSKTTIKDAKRSLRQHGISLSDFSLVDKTSNASDRQSATTAIEEELHPVQEINQDRTQEVSGISLDD